MPELGVVRTRYERVVQLGLVVFIALLFPLMSHGLPEAASTVGAAQTPSSGGVSSGVSAQGQVQLSYGFKLAPRALMPSLSLSYSSAGGDSDVGYGWSLGVSTIARDLRREDAVLDVVDDHYVADGVSLLRVAGTASGTGPVAPLFFERYGDASGTEYVFEPAINSWTERRRDGLVRRYKPLVTQQGTLPNALSEEDGPVKLRRRPGYKEEGNRSGSDRVLIWGLWQEENRDGYRVQYLYAQPRSDVQRYPTLVEIRYGGNVRLGTEHDVVISIGRYLHTPPVLLRGMMNEAASLNGLCPQGGLMAQGLHSHKLGGPLVGPEGQLVWGIGMSVADGATDNAQVFSMPGDLSAYWRLGYNRHRVGCWSVGELHANLERIESFGRDPQTGAWVAGPVARYEYYGWNRTFTSHPQRLPNGLAQPVSGSSAWLRQVPTDPTVMRAESYSARGARAGDYQGHWPMHLSYHPETGEELSYCRPTLNCIVQDQVGAPSAVQLLKDENGDAVPDYVDFFSARLCNRNADGVLPTYVAGKLDGSFDVLSSGSDANRQTLGWHGAVMDPTLAGASLVPRMGYCGTELWRSLVASAYPAANRTLGAAPFLAITGNESFQIDSDADGYSDTIRLIGRYLLMSSWLVERAPADADFAWRYYRKNPMDGSIEAPRAWANAPWSGVTASPLTMILLKTANQNVSATVRNNTSTGPDIDLDGNGEGFDWSSSELGSLADFTGDGVLDRMAAMRVGSLPNQPFRYPDGTGGNVIPENFAVTIYRGKLVPVATTAGQEPRMELQFENTPEFWWTRAEGGYGPAATAAEEQEVLSPATSASIRTRCYGPQAFACDETHFSVSQLMDMDGDGLSDIVMTLPKLSGRFARETHNYALQGGGSFRLEPLTVLYNTGRGFTRGDLRISTPPESGGLPSHLTNSRLGRVAPASDGPESGHHYVHEEDTLEQWVDFNGDGLIDRIQPRGVQFGGSGQLSAPLLVAMPAVSPQGTLERARVVRWMSDHENPGTGYEWQEMREQTIQMVDMNADGRPDWLVLDPIERTYDFYTDENMEAKPGAIKTASDGLGGRAEYTYQTVAEALQSTAFGLSPSRVPHKGFVLKRIKETLGNTAASGPVRETKLYFADGKFGRFNEYRDDGQLAMVAAGFLGFGTVVRVLPTDQRVEERYDLSFGKQGLLQSRHVYAGGRDEQLLEHTRYTYRQVSAHLRSWEGRELPGDVHLPESVSQELWFERSDAGTAVQYEPIPVSNQVRYVYPSNPLANYGAPSEVIDEGDVDDARDDVRTVQSYAAGQVNDSFGRFYAFVPTQTRSYGYDAATNSLSKLLTHVRNDYDCDPDRSNHCPGTGISQGRLRQQLVFYDAQHPDDEERSLRTRYYYHEADGVLLHARDAAGRVTSFCYGSRHAALTLTRFPDGRRQERVNNLATGAVVELRGPVGLSTRPLEGSPDAGSEVADACPAINTHEPGFGGRPPPNPLPDIPTGELEPLKVVAEVNRPAPPPASWNVPPGSGTWDPMRPVAYSYSSDPVTAALRDRRQEPVGMDVNHAGLRLPWRLAGLSSERANLRMQWPDAAVPIQGRQPYTPTVHIEYDGLGRLVRTLATTRRLADQSYLMTQLNANLEWFDDGRGGNPAGIYRIGEVLVAGDGYNAPNAKKRWQASWSDAGGRTLWSQHLANPSLPSAQQPQRFIEYGIEGLATHVRAPDPQTPGAYVATQVSNFDAWDAPRELSHSAGARLRTQKGLEWASDGPHFKIRTFQGTGGAATTQLQETDEVPRLRTTFTRTRVSEASADVMLSKQTYDELGRSVRVVSPEGQVTTYAYDLAGRPTRIARYNNEAQADADRALQVTLMEYPNYRDESNPVESYRSITTHYAADGSMQETAMTLELERATGRLRQLVKPLSTDANLLGYGATRYAYVTNSFVDGYGELESASNANETRTYTYNAQQRVDSVTHAFAVRWPGDVAGLTDQLVYHYEYEPSGLIRRTTIDTDGSFEGRLSTRYEYNEAGQLTALYDENRSTTSAVTSFDYTHTGAPWHRWDSRGGIKTLTYDHYGLLRQASLSALGWTSNYTQTIGRDETTGLPLSITTTRPDGSTHMASYKYNLAGQLTEAGESGYHTEITYRCDAGRCDSRVDTVDETLPGATPRRVRYRYAEAYDATQLTGQLNRDDSMVLRSYGYDATGALQNDGTRSYRNDPLGWVNQHDAGGYAYDAEDNQTFQYIKTPGSDTPSIAYAVMPGLEIEYQRGADGHLTRQALRRYIGNQRSSVLGTREEALLEDDVLGNLALVRKPSGNAYASYTAWGQFLTDRTQGFESEWFGYKGGRIDKTGTGLYRFGARSYDPSINRWTSRDPITTQLPLVDAYNAFGSNPITNADPSGLQQVPGQNPVMTPMESNAQGITAQRSDLDAGYPPLPKSDSVNNFKNEYWNDRGMTDGLCENMPDPASPGENEPYGAAYRSGYLSGINFNAGVRFFSQLAENISVGTLRSGQRAAGPGLRLPPMGMRIPTTRPSSPGVRLSVNTPAPAQLPRQTGVRAGTNPSSFGGASPPYVMNLGPGGVPRIREITTRFPGTPLVLVDTDRMALNTGVRGYALRNGGLPSNVIVLNAPGSSVPAGQFSWVLAENLHPLYVNGPFDVARALTPGGTGLVTLDTSYENPYQQAWLNSVVSRLNAEGYTASVVRDPATAAARLGFNPASNAFYTFWRMLQIDRR